MNRRDLLKLLGIAPLAVALKPEKPVRDPGKSVLVRRHWVRESRTVPLTAGIAPVGTSLLRQDVDVEFKDYGDHVVIDKENWNVLKKG